MIAGSVGKAKPRAALENLMATGNFAVVTCIYVYDTSRNCRFSYSVTSVHLQLAIGKGLAGTLRKKVPAPIMLQTHCSLYIQIHVIDKSLLNPDYIQIHLVIDKSLLLT